MVLGNSYPNLAGAFIELQAQPLRPDLWTRIQWQDASGNWHGIDGWQGSFNPDQRVLWYVGPDHLGDGPFRWLVYEHQGGGLLTMSQPFNLPSRGGEVLHVEVSLLPPGNTTSAAQSGTTPSAPATGSTPGGVLADNFDDPAYDGRYNSSFWTATNGCADAVQREGVITFQSTCDLAARPRWVPFDELGVFEAEVKIASDHNGETVVTQEILFLTHDLPGGTWWVTCGLRAEDSGASAFLHVFDEGNASEGMYATLPAEYDRWYTIRLEVDHDTMAFRCIVDDHLRLGAFIPADKAAIREARFERLLEAARSGTAFATTAANYVRLTEPPQNE